MPKKGSHPVRAHIIQELRQSRSMTVEDLSEKSGISVRRLRAILQGENAYLKTIGKIADALDIPADKLRADLPQEPIGTATRFSLDLSMKGDLDDLAKLGTIATIPPRIIALLAQHGIKVDEHQVALNVAEFAGNEMKRTTVLALGVHEEQTSWLIVAVKTYKLTLFKDDYRANAIDWSHFESYGEIIGAGKGIDTFEAQGIPMLKDLYQKSPNIMTTGCIVHCSSKAQSSPTLSAMESLYKGLSTTLK